MRVTLFARMLAALCVLLLVACANNPDPTPQPSATPVPPTPTPTPRELVGRAARATLAAQTLQFRVAVTGAPVPADALGVFFLNSIEEGALQRPDAVRAALKVSTSASTAEIRTVSVGGRQYITNPITRSWLCIDAGLGFNPAVLFDPETGIEQVLLNDMTAIDLVAVEQIEGVAHHHLRGQIAPEPLIALSGGYIGKGTVTTDLYARVDDGRITRLLLADPGTSAETANTWEFTFSNFGEPVEIIAPPDVTCP